MYLPNKYTNWYNSIITKARERVNQSDAYVETHHVVPKSLGGSNDLTNLVKLTAKEHFVCHMLLIKMTTGDSKRRMINAAWGMAIRKNRYQDSRVKVNSRMYEYIKSNLTQSNESNLARSKKLKGRTLGPMSESHKEKLRKPKTEETKRKMSAARIGKTWNYKHTSETKSKMSDWQKGIPKIKVKCEHCGKEMSQMNYSRWHGVKCKSLDRQQ